MDVGFAFGNFITPVLRANPCENVVIEVGVAEIDQQNDRLFSQKIAGCVFLGEEGPVDVASIAYDLLVVLVLGDAIEEGLGLWKISELIDAFRLVT